MKRIYLVRHGRTVFNEKRLFQDGEDVLSDAGKRQAITLAERLSNLEFQKIICSDYKRTKQTAEPIVEATGVPIEYSPLWREEKRPSSFIGKSDQSEEGKQYYKELIEKASDKDFTFADGENAHDVHERVKQALEQLNKEEAESILVVSHGDFIRMFVAHLLLKEQGSTEEVATVRKVLRATNTGVTMVEYDKGVWRVLTWNDHAHFAE